MHFREEFISFNSCIEVSTLLCSLLWSLFRISLQWCVNQDTGLQMSDDDDVTTIWWSTILLCYQKFIAIIFWRRKDSQKTGQENRADKSFWKFLLVFRLLLAALRREQLQCQHLVCPTNVHPWGGRHTNVLLPPYDIKLALSILQINSFSNYQDVKIMRCYYLFIIAGQFLLLTSHNKLDNFRLHWRHNREIFYS